MNSDSRVTRPAQTYSGACPCGAVQIEAAGEPLEMGYCHCNGCRSYSGAPVSAFLLFKQENLKITGGAAFLGRFASSEMSDRRFCTKCGGALMSEHPRLGLTDLRPAAFAAIAFRPMVHLNYKETVLRIGDGLPKLKHFPAHAGGSGETLPNSGVLIVQAVLARAGVVRRKIGA